MNSSNSHGGESVTLTEAALAKALEIQSEQASYRGKALRLYLEGKGCDGFYYGVSFDDRLENDVIFSQKNVLEEVVELVVDSESLPFVSGATIDWVDDDRGAGFLVDNPNHRRFRGKFFKRSAWREHYEAKGAAPDPSVPSNAN